MHSRTTTVEAIAKKFASKTGLTVEEATGILNKLAPPEDVEGGKLSFRWPLTVMETELLLMQGERCKLNAAVAGK